MSNLRLSHPSKEGVLHVSKWLKTQVLLDSQEMRELFSCLMPLKLYNVSEVVKDDDIEPSMFLESYSQYIEALKSGHVLDSKDLRRLFSLALSSDSSLLYKMEVKPHQYLIKAVKPIIQMQLHQFLPSSLDGKFHPMVLSSESVSWGVQFSYPQIYQDPQTNHFSKILSTPEFPNTLVFDKLTKWLRNFSVPTTFIWNSVKTATPIRLGKQCFSWINHHPQLKKKEIQVHVY